ncbi:MAG: sigma-70 family RNA polymerase sigma factor [Dehalococcoidia bacterium]
MLAKPPQPLSSGEGPNIELAVIELFETCYARVVRYIAFRTGRTHEAEDMASEVFLRALRNAHTYEDTGKPLEAWIFRIAHNMVVDHLRKMGRRGRSVPLDETSAITSSDSVHANVEREDQLAELRAAIAKLPPAQREVVTLRFGAEMKPGEIAEAIGKKPTTVRWLQHAAVERLRTLMRVDVAEAHPPAATP